MTKKEETELKKLHKLWAMNPAKVTGKQILRAMDLSRKAKAEKKQAEPAPL